MRAAVKRVSKALAKTAPTAAKKYGPTLDDYERNYGRATTRRDGDAPPVRAPVKAPAKAPAAAAVPKVRVMTDVTGQNPPIVMPLPQYTASPLDPTASGRMEAAAGLGNRMQAAIAGNPVTTVQPATGMDSMEVARLAALNAVLEKLMKSGQTFYQPGTANDPYMGTPGYQGQPYQYASLVGGGTGDSSSFVPGSAQIERTTPAQANDGRGQMTAPAIAAYILNAWGTPDGRQDPNVGNMTADNIAFLQNLT